MDALFHPCSIQRIQLERTNWIASLEAFAASMVCFAKCVEQKQMEIYLKQATVLVRSTLAKRNIFKFNSNSSCFVSKELALCFCTSNMRGVRGLHRDVQKGSKRWMGMTKCKALNLPASRILRAGCHSLLLHIRWPMSLWSLNPEISASCKA